ncbi:MarR family winged helix-turn-helix transcriptional regulator [Marinomonas posidonica]|uniref:Transcriptional regulator, MarR family n=1 Tax=Marinomonas posidonica (strain CECT 7376 / NCIMB 14433 / IVIA-Po-181) TaxID=491952 RepID=F6CYM0_MARPP|nr:MarR family winged helix-turn-helix transcriptional regulator [Marinomonas posidonica]AEF55702.1 transcriptional regulator, MarR family [Marinomonas posidonica IVIA-Po-181]
MSQLESKLQLMFIHTINALQQSMKQTMKHHQLKMTPLSFLMLKTVHDTAECTAHSIAEITYKDKGQITRLLKEVIDQGLIERHPNPKDKRSQILTLTEQGETVFTTLQQADYAALNALKTGLTEEELNDFLIIGQKMIHNINEFNAKCG